MGKGAILAHRPAPSCHGRLPTLRGQGGFPYNCALLSRPGLLAGRTGRLTQR